MIFSCKIIKNHIFRISAPRGDFWPWIFIGTHQDVQTSVAHPVVVAVYQLKIGFRDFWMDFLEMVSIFGCSLVLWTMENGAKIIEKT